MFYNSRNFSPPEVEEKVLKFWQEKKIFEKSLKKTEKGKPFTFYDGPPFATGLPHYGHILASTIKDLIPRYQTMKGRFVRRRWGWDCHGLPIEEIVERILKISGKKQIEKIGIGKFNEICRSKVLEYAAEWKKVVERIARWVDFDNSYKTMDNEYMESVWWAFKEIYKKGLIYEGQKVLLYCPRCETPISNFEVAMDNSYKEVKEESIVVKFKIENKKFKVKEPVYFLAWTTTPWTLPANVALAVGENISYVLAQKDNENLILAKNRLFSISGDYKILEEFTGEQLIGIKYKPLFGTIKSENAFKVYPADFVTTDEGTGIVHIAPAYGEDDYRLGTKFGLPVVSLLDEKGRFNKKAPKIIQGLYFKESENVIKDDLEKRNLLFEKTLHLHSYPFCWRCGATLYYNAIPAWFVNIQKIKKALIESNIKEINWFPSHLKRGRYEKSIEAAPDWNISRNRYWGNPIPVWKCQKCGNKRIIGSLAEIHQAVGGAKNNYWVIRHGEAESNLQKIIDVGRKNIQLTKKGRKQIERAASKLKGKKIDFIFSSDVLRTKETAKIIATKLGKRVIFDKRLREINLSVLSGKSVKDYYLMFPSYEERFEKKVAGIETLEEVRVRLWDFLSELEKKYKNKNILIVSHEYPLWMLAAVAAGWGKSKAIEEKKKRDPEDFIRTGEIRKLDFIVAPRNKLGEIDLHRPYIDSIVFSCENCGGLMKRVPEIFDSWIEAGSMPFAEYHYPFENRKIFESRLPAQFVAEYIAQTRAWFYVMHVISLILFGKAPFENVVTTGTILAEDGTKMSKSKGNFPDPWEVINKYGVDALRFYLMNSVVMKADNLNFNVGDLEIIYRKVVIVLWNVYKYFELYADRGKLLRANLNKKSSFLLDRWLDVRTSQLLDKVTKSFDNYDTVEATRSIADYIDDLSLWYLRRSRKRQDINFFKTLYRSLLVLSKIIAPVMPYLAEVLYQNLSFYSKNKFKESVHLEKWPAWQVKQTKQDALLLEKMAEVRRLASLILSKRMEAGIKVRQPLKEVKILPPKFQFPKELIEILKDEVNIKKITFDSKIKEEIELDTKLTPELKEEGIIRELTRIVQFLRQKASLTPKERIVLTLELPEEFKIIVERNKEVLKENVGASKVKYGKTNQALASTETKIDEWLLWIAIEIDK